MDAPVPLPPALGDLLRGADWLRDEEGEAGAVVHRVSPLDGGAFYLKYGVGPVAADLLDEAVRLRWLAGRVPAAAVRLFTCDERAAWLLTEALPGRTADAWIAEDPTRLPRIVRALAAFMRRLHALPVDECSFDAGDAVRLAQARGRVSAGLVDKDDFDEERLGRSATEVLAEAERLLPTASGRVVVHGDFTANNVLLDEAGAMTGCIDVGRLGVGDPYQDVAALWGDLGEYGAETQRLLLLELEIGEPDEERLLFQRCLGELF